MTRALAVALVFVLLAVTLAAEPHDAAPRDIQRLQEDLANLDEQLVALDEVGAPGSAELRDRAAEIREEAIYLKVLMRRHQRAGQPGTGVDMAQLVELRRAIVELAQDVEDATTLDARSIVLPSGTRIHVRLEDALSSKTARTEDRIEAVVAEPVRVGRVLAVPAGSRVRGTVRAADRAQRLSRGGRLELDFDTLYAGAERVDLVSRVVAIPAGGGDEIERKEKAAGLAAVLGGVLGGILGGNKGAAVGVIIGGGAVVANKGEDVELPSGTVLTVQLEREVELRPYD